MIRASTETIKIIIVSKFEKNTYHMNESEMKKKINLQDDETDSLSWYHYVLILNHSWTSYTMIDKQSTI